MSTTRQLLISGEGTPARSGRTTDVINPGTGKVYDTVAAAGAEDVTLAVDAAHAAFEDWAAVDPFTRRTIFLKAADLMEERLEHMVEVMSGEVSGTRLRASLQTRRACSAGPLAQRPVAAYEA